mmetsp:Transcript_6307/g.19045  ORF Transcript_6307/g.19045 Transcript_6307/m.19045 type:complete len:205 (+) Transcript_6307:1838-2452(+)
MQVCIGEPSWHTAGTLDHLIVQPGSFILNANPPLSGYGLIDDTNDRFASLKQSYQCAERRLAGHKCLGSIDGIQNPRVLFVSAGLGPKLLANNSVRWDLLLQYGAHPRLCGHVCGCHWAQIGLGIDFRPFKGPVVWPDRLAGRICQAKRQTHQSRWHVLRTHRQPRSPGEPTALTQQDMPACKARITHRATSTIPSVSGLQLLA